MGELKALIFDVDGTLADTERDGHRVAFNRAFEDAGLEWNWNISDYGNLLEIAGGKERLQYFINHIKPEKDLLDAQPSLVDRLHELKTAHYLSILKAGAIPLRSGVERLISEARNADITLAIATTSSIDSVVGLLESTRGRVSPGWFAIIGAGDIVERKKPAPDIYLYVLSSLGFSTKDCLTIEDSRNGLLAARGAGLTTLVTVNDYTHHENMTGAALVVDQLGEPDQPFNVLTGDAGSKCYVTLDLIKHLLH